MNNKHALWVEKYRPTSLDKIIFQDKQTANIFKTFITDQTVPHLLLSGVQGSGKTTISNVLVTELNIESSDVLRINASDENSVDVMRDKIKAFITTYCMSDTKFKIVQLEEFDHTTGNAQAILRQMMEEHSEHARFILTCNYEHKILPAIKSRCQHFKFKALNKQDISEYVETILLTENIEYELNHVDEYIAIGYPDVRSIINRLQQNSSTGKLLPPKEIDDGDYKFKLLDLLKDNNWQEIRRMACSNVGLEEWESVYRFLYENIDKCFTNQNIWEAAVVILSDHMYKNDKVADREINFAACTIKIGQISKS